MTTVLLTRDLDALRALSRPRWQRRALKWTIPVAAFMVLTLQNDVTPIPACTPASPCTPDPASALALGLALAIAVAGLIDANVAGWLAAAGTVTGITYDLFHPAVAAPEWLYLVELALVAVCLAVARAGRVRQPNGSAISWFATVHHQRPPTPEALPRLGRGWRITASGLVLLALGFAAWAWSVQTRMDARQRAAERVPAEVVRQLDESSIQVRTTDGQSTDLDVLDSSDYHSGQWIEMYVDNAGLHQPVDEPYDASGWLILTAMLAGAALACRQRSARAQAGLDHLVGAAQPATQAYVRIQHGHMVVYPGDARAWEPAAAVFRVLAPSEVDSDEEAVLSATQPAMLYGVPAPGQWCMAVVDGVPVLPLRPAYASVAAPVFTDPLVTVDFETVPAQPTPRPEQIETLSPADRDGNPYRLRTHTPPALYGYWLMAAGPLALIGVVMLLPRLSFVTALGFAAAVLALSCWIGWRLCVRPRAAWNGAGIAIVGIFGTARLRWSDVLAIAVRDGVVTVQTARGGWGVPAFSLPGPLRGAQYNAVQLATALRLAHERGMAPPAALDPPRLAVPATPIWPYLLWLGWSPVLAWLFAAFSR